MSDLLKWCPFATTRWTLLFNTLMHPSGLMHSLDRLFDSQRFRSGFRCGPFSRSVPLPDDVKEGDIKATYSDGVLDVPANLSDQAAQPAAPKTPALVHGPYRRSRRAPTITAVLPRQLASSCPRDSRCQVRLAADDMLFTRNGAQSVFAVHDTERLFES